MSGVRLWVDGLVFEKQGVTLPKFVILLTQGQNRIRVLNSTVISFHSQHLVVNFNHIFNIQVQLEVLNFLDFLLPQRAMSWTNVALHFRSTRTFFLELAGSLRDYAEVLFLNHLLLTLVEELLDVSVELVVFTHLIHLVLSQGLLNHVVLHRQYSIPAVLSVESVFAVHAHGLRLLIKHLPPHLGILGHFSFFFLLLQLQSLSFLFLPLSEELDHLFGVDPGCDELENGHFFFVDVRVVDVVVVVPVLFHVDVGLVLRLLVFVRFSELRVNDGQGQVQQEESSHENQGHEVTPADIEAVLDLHHPLNVTPPFQGHRLEHAHQRVEHVVEVGHTIVWIFIGFSTEVPSWAIAVISA